jgi:shikimate kinase
VSAIALVGFMGAGKTTVGRELAARLGWQFQDLDSLIEQRQGRSIAEIFDRDGEPAFRKMELSLLHEVIEADHGTHMVIALGGGAFAQANVQECLTQAGIPSVFLDASVDELFRRCEQPGIVRPLRRHPEQFRELYEDRRPAYCRANLQISTGGKEIGAIANEIISRIGLVSTGVSE